MVIDINTTLCPIKGNSNTIELTVHTSCYCILDLLCVSNLILIPPRYSKDSKKMYPKE